MTQGFVAGVDGGWTEGGRRVGPPPKEWGADFSAGWNGLLDLRCPHVQASTCTRQLRGWVRRSGERRGLQLQF